MAVSYGFTPALIYKAFTNNNDPLSGGKLYTFLAGTTTPENTFKDISGSHNDNPVILDPRGEAVVLLDTAKAYKFVLTDANDVPVGDPVDNITSSGGAISGGGTDQLVKVSAVDEVAGYLNTKLIAGTNCTLTLVNGAIGDSLQIDIEAPAPVIETIEDTQSIDLTLTGTELKADVKISGAFGNIAEILADGLYVPSGIDGGDYIAKDGTTTTTDQIPFAQGLSSALGASITAPFGDGSALKIPDSTWIRPQTAQGGLYLTNGINASPTNSILQLTNTQTLLTAGDGTSQFGRVSIDDVSLALEHYNNGSVNSNIRVEDNAVIMESDSESSVALTNLYAYMHGGNAELILADTSLILQSNGKGFDVDAIGIKPQGIDAGIVTTNSFVGLNTAGYLVKSAILSTTTAGVLNRIYLNPLDVIVNGTTYNTLTSDGAGATNETQSVSSNNTLETFATSFISDGYLTEGVIHAGGYTANIWINTNNCNHEVDYYIEVYLTDSLGVNISLLGTLASGGLVLADNNDHSIQLTTSIPADVNYVVNQRIKFVVKAIKNTTVGGSHTLSIKYGITHASYIDIPVDITTDMVTDTRNGDILTASLNALQPLDADLTAISALSADGLLRKSSGTWGMDAVVYATQTALDLKADLASPTFTGDAKAVTPALGDNDTSIATTNFVQSAINSVTTTASTATLSVNSLTTTQANIIAQAVGLTIGVPTGASGGRKLILRIKDNGTARAITFDAIFRAIGVTLPATTVVNKILYIGAIYNSADAKWDVVSVAQQT